jgi:hypothetical protein
MYSSRLKVVAVGSSECGLKRVSTTILAACNGCPPKRSGEPPIPTISYSLTFDKKLMRWEKGWKNC